MNGIDPTIKLPEALSWYIAIGLVFWIFIHAWIYHEIEYEVDVDENWLVIALTALLYGIGWGFFVPLFAICWCIGRIRKFYFILIETMYSCKKSIEKFFKDTEEDVGCIVGFIVMLLFCVWLMFMVGVLTNHHRY